MNHEIKPDYIAPRRRRLVVCAEEQGMDCKSAPAISTGLLSASYLAVAMTRRRKTVTARNEAGENRHCEVRSSLYCLPTVQRDCFVPYNDEDFTCRNIKYLLTIPMFYYFHPAFYSLHGYDLILLPTNVLFLF
jgi:hypothetical protein